jgi:4-amino-4-deoxy-L-arabinose transferase-like glycosyltransferase
MAFFRPAKPHNYNIFTASNLRAMLPQVPPLSSYKWLLMVGIGLFLYAYLSHLGTLPIDARTDEGRRALVTAEMVLSGNYVVPTLNGEPFLNKPPLYNWLMAACVKLGGSFHPFWLRLPVVLAIALFGVFIYGFVKKYTHSFLAAVVALAFVTNGRILIYDSLQSFIDLSFGCCMYATMMLIFYFGQQKKYLTLFLATYALTAAGFLMKGLPALVFEAISLLVYFGYTKRVKLLLGWQHALGIALLTAILGAYYWAYFNATQLTPALLFARLLSESTDRTVVKFGFWETLLHFLYYPFEMMYHYVPWLLLLVVLLQKNVFRTINAHPFVQYNWWVFLANFLVYWTSPQVYARYLFPLLPLLLTVLVYLFFQLKPTQWQRKWPEWLLGGILALLPLGLLAVPFVPAASGGVAFGTIKALALAVALGALVVWYFRQQPLRLLTLGVALLVVRVGFNWFVVDQRGDYLRQMEQTADKMVRLAQNNPLYLQRGAQLGNFDGMSFFVSTRRGEVLRFDSSFSKTAFYIADSTVLAKKPHVLLLEFKNPFADQLYLVQYR